GQRHSYQQRAHANRGERKAKELDEGGANVKLPDQHGPGPAIKDNVASVRELSCDKDVGAVVGDTNICEGPTYEFADQHGHGAEQSRNPESMEEWLFSVDA